MSSNRGYSMTSNASLQQELQDKSAFEILSYFLFTPAPENGSRLDYAAVVCIDTEWWMKEPKPTTELGIAELTWAGMHPTVHAENILSGIQAAHARVIEYAHLKNNFPGAGDPENFYFGKTKFVTWEECKQVLINNFVRQNEDTPETDLQPIIMVGHAVENEFDHLQRAFGVDLQSYGTIVKVVDTQAMAQELGIQGPRGPAIGLKDLLAHFNIEIPNLHTAGNDAAATLIAAVLLTLKHRIYPNVSGPPPAVVQGRSISGVITSMIQYCNSRPPPPWGKSIFCTRCDRENHVRQDCTALVSCSICRNSGVRKLFASRYLHKTSRCLYQFLDKPPPDWDVSEW